MTRTAMKVSTPAVSHAGLCGAAKRAGGTCRNVAGYKTEHVGSGRCFLHGGRHPIKHGRYSTMKREALRELIAHHETDPDPLDIFPELAAARALFQDFVDRYDEWRDALIAWHESFSEAYREARMAAWQRWHEAGEPGGEFIPPEPLPDKPREVLDIGDARGHVSEVTKIAERIEKIRAANAISRPDLLRVMSEMTRVVHAHVPDEDAREKIADGWLSIRL